MSWIRLPGRAAIEPVSACLVIVAAGFCRENIRLQPWRYIFELALREARYRRVVIVTNADEHQTSDRWEEGIELIATPLLSPRYRKPLSQLVRSFAPSELWWSTTPRTIAYRKLLRQLDCTVIAMLTGPLYTWGELWCASRGGVPFSELKSHWLQSLVPRRLFARFLSGHWFQSVYVQSEANRQRLIESGLSARKIIKVPVGIDESDRKVIPYARVSGARDRLGFDHDCVVFGYFGALRPIRGYSALMKAIPIASGRDAKVRLAIFARGADESGCNAIREQAKDLAIGDRVTVVGGWLSREDVWANIEACDAVVLPFVIVESDVPIAILEALARGRPVIASPVDGIPELIEGRGLIVNPLDTHALAMAMVRLSRDDALLHRLGNAAREFMATYPTWNEVSDKLIARSE